MNAMRRPSTPLKIIGVTSRYLTCTPTNTRLSTAKTAAARIVSCGCQWNAAGTMSPTVHTSSRMPRVIQASRGNAPKDGTSLLTLSNMKTFMTPDDAYRSAARTCRTHNRMFIGCLVSDPAEDRRKNPPGRQGCDARGALRWRRCHVPQSLHRVRRLASPAHHHRHALRRL